MQDPKQARERARGQRDAHLVEMANALEDATTLAHIRSGLRVTQRALATTLGLPVKRIARIERGHDVYLTVLDEYLQALGGRLEVTAVFPEARIRLSPRDEAESRRPAEAPDRG